jgi:hypothetical protein
MRAELGPEFGSRYIMMSPSISSGVNEASASPGVSATSENIAKIQAAGPTGWMRGYGTAAHRSLMTPELVEGLRERSPGRSKDDLAAQMLFDVFQGVLLHRMRDPAAAADGLTAEVDMATDLILRGSTAPP